MKAVLIAGNKSGAGKTSITLALASYFSRTETVQTFKCATDYIDTSYHAGVTHRPCYNFDSYIQHEDEIAALFSVASAGADLALVEGVRGLFEGIEALSESGSTASIAKQLHLPVILVVDARSITRSAAALVLGFQHFDPEVAIVGVILNNIGHGSHGKKAKEAIEYYCGIPVLGLIPRSESMELSSRHLGLIPYLEAAGKSVFVDKIDEITDFVIRHLDIEKIEALLSDVSVSDTSHILDSASECRGTIGVAYDKAFCFYYGELDAVLASIGYRVIRFSPLSDTLPEADGYIFGGGYPELFAKELSENVEMLKQIKDAAERGVPIYAECGGLMYLMRSIEVMGGWHGIDKSATYTLCGVFEGVSRIPVRKRLGYVEGTIQIHEKTFPLKGHEFHYSGVFLAEKYQFSIKLNRGFGISDGFDGIRYKNVLASYTHLMPVSSRAFLKEFFMNSKK